MKKEIRKIVLIFCVLLSVILLPAVVASSMPQDVAEENNSASVDSLAIAETARLVEKASGSYKNLKFIQYDGVTEEELYPQVMTVYEDVRDALAAPALESSDMTRFKGILLDLSDLIRKGSIFSFRTVRARGQPWVLEMSVTTKAEGSNLLPVPMALMIFICKVVHLAIKSSFAVTVSMQSIT